ncbi:hypothetical protein RhiJN_20269 [Ceratobasidium sp. AG-Ba]|nr:hypothetical protein RhiJN_20269 [Ceratobasidium sp. AG-Ba]
MSDRSPVKKKARYRPPQAPRTVAKPSTTEANHYRSQDLPGSVHPPPTATQRASVSTAAHAPGIHPLPAPKFEEVPHADHDRIGDPDSDDPDRDMGGEDSDDYNGTEECVDEGLDDNGNGGAEIYE